MANGIGRWPASLRARPMARRRRQKAAPGTKRGLRPSFFSARISPICLKPPRSARPLRWPRSASLRETLSTRAARPDPAGPRLRPSGSVDAVPCRALLSVQTATARSVCAKDWLDWLTTEAAPVARSQPALCLFTGCRPRSDSAVPKRSPVSKRPP